MQKSNDMVRVGIRAVLIVRRI